MLSVEKMRFRSTTIFFALAIIAAGVAGVFFYQKHFALAPQTAGALPDSVYVWQYQWNPAVADAVSSAGNDVSIKQLHVIVAEIMPGGSKPTVRRLSPDYALLAKTGKPVALLFRVGAHGGSFDAGNPMSAALAGAVKNALADAAAAGLSPAEIQIDFDCPTRCLADYAQWISSIKEIALATPVTLTALPAWLGSGGFEKLVAVADGFTLQVHGVEPPSGKDNKLSPLCDTAKARRWVEQAARIAGDKKFLVALPTYTYRVAFDSAGRYIGVAAESSANETQRAASWQLMPADAAALAALINDWTHSHPTALAGIIWYRLPVAGDQYNWTTGAWNKVRRGKMPTLSVEHEFRETTPELRDIFLKNTGDLVFTLPEKIEISWEGATPVGLDSLGGYKISERTATGAVFKKVSPAPLLLQPGDTRPLGWIRFDKPPAKMKIIAFSNNIGRSHAESVPFER